MLPAKRNLNLDDCDVIPQNTPLLKATSKQPIAFVTEIKDFKLDGKKEIVKAKTIEYFAKYPTFKEGLLTNKHIQKICCVIEKYSDKQGIDKMEMAIETMESIACRKFNDSEIELIKSTIEFLHKSKLIKVSFLLRMYHRVQSFFR